MKTIIVLFIVMFGCTSTICKLNQVLVDGMSQAVATEFSCKNIAAIKISMKSVINKLELCMTQKKAAAKGIGDDLICPLVSGPIAALALGNVLPIDWQCRLDKDNKLGEIVEAICRKVL